MLSVQEISDRLEIMQLMTAYSSAIDRKNFAALNNVFSADAYIDYRAMGGIAGTLGEIKAWLGEVMQAFPHYQHMLGNPEIQLQGDTATGRTICFNPMQIALPDGSSQVMFLGLWYLDEFVRREAGWRISRRSEEKCYAHNVPAGLNVGNR